MYHGGVTMVAAGGGYGVSILVVPKGCPYLALYMQPGRVLHILCTKKSSVLSWTSLGRQVGLKIYLQLGRIGSANGGVPGGYAHVRGLHFVASLLNFGSNSKSNTT